MLGDGADTGIWSTGTLLPSRIFVICNFWAVDKMDHQKPLQFSDMSTGREYNSTKERKLRKAKLHFNKAEKVVRP